MEIALSFLQRLAVVGFGIFALYQCFQISDHGRLSRPAAAWAVRICLIAFAAFCFFSVAHLAATS